jgi:hypothetical protein
VEILRTRSASGIAHLLRLGTAALRSKRPPD